MTVRSFFAQSQKPIGVFVTGCTWAMKSDGRPFLSGRATGQKKNLKRELFGLAKTVRKLISLRPGCRSIFRRCPIPLAEVLLTTTQSDGAPLILWPTDYRPPWRIRPSALGPCASRAEHQCGGRVNPIGMTATVPCWTTSVPAMGETHWFGCDQLRQTFCELCPTRHVTLPDGSGKRPAAISEAMGLVAVSRKRLGDICSARQ